jgi:acyl-CoA thioesterase I
MTVLRHKVPSAGLTVTARPYSGNKYMPVRAGDHTVLTATSDAQGWASFTLPDPGNQRTFWRLDRAGTDPVVVALPRQASGTLDSADHLLGTLTPEKDLVSTGATAPADLDTLAELAAVLTADRLTYAQIGRTVPGRRLAMIGDSMTAGIIGQATPNANNIVQGSPLSYGCMVSQGRLEWGGQFGVPGETTAQMLARVGQVVAARPDLCVILGGTNDGNMNTIKTNIPAIVAALLAAGIEPVLATLPPSSSPNAMTNGPHNWIRNANGWITKYAADNDLRLVDFFGPLVDPATGRYKVGHNSDITHPNQKGYRVMGEALATALSSQVKAGFSWLTQDAGDVSLFSGGDGGLFTTGTTLPAGGWSQAAGAAGAFVTDPFFAGRAYQIARAAGDTTSRVITFYVGALDWTFRPGHLVSLSCKIKTVGLEASGGVATVGAGNTGKTSGPSNMVSWQVGADFPNGGVIYFDSVIPPGTTSMPISIRIDGGSNAAGDSVSVGQFAVRNLTYLGYP